MGDGRSGVPRDPGARHLLDEIATTERGMNDRDIRETIARAGARGDAALESLHALLGAPEAAKQDASADLQAIAVIRVDLEAPVDERELALGGQRVGFINQK